MLTWKKPLYAYPKTSFNINTPWQDGTCFVIELLLEEITSNEMPIISFMLFELTLYRNYSSNYAFVDVNIKAKNDSFPKNVKVKLSLLRTHFGLSLKYSYNISIFTAIRLSFSSSFFTFHKTDALSYLPILNPFFPPYLIKCCTPKRIYSNTLPCCLFYFS